MNLRDYLKSRSIKREDFAKKIDCTYQYLTLLLTEKKTPGPKTINAIIRATKGNVTKKDLLNTNNTCSKKEHDNENHQSDIETPPESFICSDRNHKFLPNIEHNKPIRFTVMINDTVLVSKILHGYIQEAKDSYDYANEELKLQCCIDSEISEKFVNVVEH